MLPAQRNLEQRLSVSFLVSRHPTTTNYRRDVYAWRSSSRPLNQPPLVKTLPAIASAFLLLASAAFAASPAPNVQILAKSGKVTVYQAITDGEGKFATPPLEPGIYLFEVRGPKIIGATRYFLSLAGARPAGETLTDAAGNIAMQAEVRRPTSVRGQVRATRVLRLPPPDAMASQANGDVSPLNPVTASSTAYRPPSSQSAAFTTTPTAARATPVTQMTRSGTAPSRDLSATRSPLPQQPMIIGGKRYIWAPATGTNPGRWVLDPNQRRVREAAPTTPASNWPASQSGR